MLLVSGFWCSGRAFFLVTWRQLRQLAAVVSRGFFEGISSQRLWFSSLTHQGVPFWGHRLKFWRSHFRSSSFLQPLGWSLNDRKAPDQGSSDSKTSEMRRIWWIFWDSIDHSKATVAFATPSPRAQFGEPRTLFIGFHLLSFFEHFGVEMSAFGTTFSFSVV